MKLSKLLVPFTAIVFICCTSCHFSKGVKKEVSTGLSASYNGFGVNDIYLADADGNKTGTHEIALGKTVKIIANGVTHFTEKDGKVYPGCTIILTDKNKKELLNIPDAFSDATNGWPTKEATLLSAELKTGDPMAAGETYHLSARFYDKNNKENEIVADVDLLAK